MGMFFNTSVPDPFPDLMTSTETRQSMTRTLDSIQVPFSSISVVCLTPMNWLLKPAIFPARPPPFGLWISTMAPSKMEANMTMATKITVMTIVLLLLLSGQQKYGYWQDFANLICCIPLLLSLSYPVLGTPLPWLL